MKKIYVCSPYRDRTRLGRIRNVENARKYCRKIALEGNMPIAPHIYFTLFLNDDVKSEREFAIEMNMKLIDMCDELHVCGLCISEGMRDEIHYARVIGKPVVFK